MSSLYNEKLASIEVYKPIVGQFDVYMDANESYKNLPKSIVDEIIQSIEALAFNRYPDYNCCALRAAASQVFGVDADNIVAGNGSDELIMLIISALLQKGESILATEPDFSMYKFYAHISEVIYVPYLKNKRLNISVDEFIDKVRQTCPRLIIFSNPCNPTGQAITANDVERIIAATSGIVVVDEAYMEFFNQSVIPLIYKYDNLIVLKTLSKCYSAASIRLGFALGGTSLIDALNSARSPYNVSALTQVAGEIILKNSGHFAAAATEILVNKNELYEDLTKLSKKYPLLGLVHETHTNFVYIQTNLAQHIYNELLKRSIKIRLGLNNLRITTGNKQDNTRLVKAIIEIMADMKEED